MLEAMASALPIVTTRCEGVEELIKDNGIVVEEPDAGEIAKAIKKLLCSSHLRKQMSIAARKHAEKFSWHSIAEQYIRCYKDISKDKTTYNTDRNSTT